MSSPETPSAIRPSLARDWLYALRYWLRGRNGVIALILLAAVIGAALSWSWLVAVGIAPLLLAFAPCAAMCALGLCASRIGGKSCSVQSDAPSAPRPEASLRAVESADPGIPRVTQRPPRPLQPIATEAPAAEPERHQSLREGD